MNINTYQLMRTNIERSIHCAILNSRRAKSLAETLFAIESGAVPRADSNTRSASALLILDSLSAARGSVAPRWSDGFDFVGDEEGEFVFGVLGSQVD